MQSKEPCYPLEVYVCDGCFLVQLEEFESPEHIFHNYAYFSSYSATWLEHSRQYAEKMISLFDIGKNSLVIEAASNDGYLLQFFLQKGIPVLGIEPALNVAETARQKGIPTETLFLGAQTAQTLVSEGKQADLLLGNNVLGHVPDLNDFVSGLKILLKPEGVITTEFPHLLRLIEETQFDTIYHEHFSYFSFFTAEKVFRSHGMEIFDVEEIPTHGGSLRIYAKHAMDNTKNISPRVKALIERETNAGYKRLDAYTAFSEKVEETKKNVLRFLSEAKTRGKSIAGYGAPAKGNTLLNYCGVSTNFIDYTVDRNPYKQGKFLPGSHIPVETPEKIKQTKPDYLFILPWNLKDEIMEQTAYIREWGGKFVIPVPRLQVI